MISCPPGGLPCKRQLPCGSHGASRSAGALSRLQRLQNLSYSRRGVACAPRRDQHTPLHVQSAADAAEADEGPSFSSGTASSLTGSATGEGLVLEPPRQHGSQDHARDGNGATEQRSIPGSQAGSHSAGTTGLRTPQSPDAGSRGGPEQPGDHAPDSWLRSHYDSEIFRLAIPALAAVMLDPLMGLVDTAIVGRLGAPQLGAVGLATVRRSYAAGDCFREPLRPEV